MSGTQAIQIQNERTKLTATMVNNVAVAFVVFGFVAPTVNGSSGSYQMAWIIVGVALHYVARAILGGLK